MAAACVLLAGCGSSKGGGTTIVLTTGTASTSSLPAKRYRVPAGSMEPTLKIGEYVEAQPGQPAVGEIAVLHPPEGAAQEQCGPGTSVTPGGAACSEPLPQRSSLLFIKRIVAGPGDTIKVVEGHVYRNGKREADSYIRPCPGVAECNFPVAIKVAAGDWYMLGDNRGESDDSRFWGPVPTAWIVGIVKE